MPKPSRAQKLSIKSCSSTKSVRKLTYENLEVRRVFSSWTNPDQAMDVSADRWLTPLDALLIINRILEREEGGDGLGAAGVAPFVDVSGDARLSPIDALLVINGLNNQNPVVFTMLTNDTAFGGGRDSDRITADASVDGWIQFAKTKDRIFAGWDITTDQDLKDVTSARSGINFEIREETINQLLGQPLTQGSHTLTIVLKRDAAERFRSTFSFTVDRNAT